MQSSVAVGNDSKGSRKDGGNGAGLGRNIQGGGTVGVTLRKRELGGDQGDDQVTDGVPTLVVTTDLGDDGETWVRQRVEVSSGKEGDRIRRYPPHWSIHQEMEDDHRVECGLPDHICTFHRGREDTGDEVYGVIVRSRRGK